jgi:shikimate kinase
MQNASILSMKEAPNIVLIGPMGSGKSSLGRRLAERFDLRFIDVDSHLEKITGVSIPTIFELEGEHGFREREEQALHDVLEQQDQLIATGGGAILRETNRRMITARGFVVFLNISVDEQLRRLARDKKRPLLQVDDREKRLRDLAEQRSELYKKTADLNFHADNLSLAQSLQRLIPLIRDRWSPQRITNEP